MSMSYARSTTCSCFRFIFIFESFNFYLTIPSCTWKRTCFWSPCWNFKFAIIGRSLSRYPSESMNPPSSGVGAPSRALPDISDIKWPRPHCAGLAGADIWWLLCTEASRRYATYRNVFLLDMGFVAMQKTGHIFSSMSNSIFKCT